jgi:hypothetical protein
VHLIKQRWRTERVYEDLKGELGLDHFEGRRFAGRSFRQLGDRHRVHLDDQVEAIAQRTG